MAARCVGVRLCREAIERVLTVGMRRFSRPGRTRQSGRLQQLSQLVGGSQQVGGPTRAGPAPHPVDRT